MCAIKLATELVAAIYCHSIRLRCRMPGFAACAPYRYCFEPMHLSLQLLHLTRQLQPLPPVGVEAQHGWQRQPSRHLGQEVAEGHL